MSTLSTIYPTLLDYKLRTDPDGKIAEVIELLAMQNEIIPDAVTIEANDTTSHTTTVRSGLPSVTWKRLNYGVQPTKSRSVQVKDTMGHLYAIAEVDKDLLELNGNSADWMLSEHMAFIESMNQEFSSTLFYGNEGTDPAEFTGLSPRFNDQSAENGGNIITSASTPDSTDNTSIWLVGWGPNATHLIYPKGSKMGLQVENHGLVMSENQGGTGLRGMVHRTTYSWKVGLVVRDWRQIARINFDLEDVIAAGTSGPVLYDLMVQAMHKIHNLNSAKFAWYCNRETLALIDRQSLAKANMGFNTVVDAQGKIISSFRGIPIHQCDSILNTESGI